MLEPLVQVRPVFVHRDVTIEAAVRVLIERAVSCVLVYDDRRAVVGILTERDVVRRFTLLDLDQK